MNTRSKDATLLERLLHTDDGWAPFAQRTALGLVMFPHGAQKLLGWFGGYGFSGTMGYFTGPMHMPAPLAFLVICAEFFGAVGLLVGAGTRIAAFGVTAVMLGAIATTHAQFGFFMNWFGAQQGEGFEYHLLALALCVPLMISGAGRWAVDSAILERLTPRLAVAQASNSV